MAGWHHRLNGQEFEHPLGDGEGQGSLVCFSPLGYKESDTTQRLKDNKINKTIILEMLHFTAFSHNPGQTVSASIIALSF